MFLKRFMFLKSERLFNLSRVLMCGNSSNVNNSIGQLFLSKRNSIEAIGVSQFRRNSTESLRFSDNDDREKDDDKNDYFSLIHEKVSAEKREEIFQEISKGDEKILKKLKIIDYEVNVLRNQLYKVPNVLTRAMYEELLSLSSIPSRLRYLKFLFSKERKKENESRRKLRKIEVVRKEWKERINQGLNTYKVGDSSMFIRIYDSTLAKLHQERQLAAQMFSQTVVFDCSYDSYMNMFRGRNCAQQLLFSYVTNVNHKSPFAIKLCNFEKSGTLRKHFCSLVPNFNEENHPWDFHSESFLDLYDHDKIVYLSPHASTELTEWNHDAVFVIGAFVDKGYSIPVSKVKIQQAKIKGVKLPIDSFVRWRVGDKSLALNTVLKILLDMRYYQDWNKAFTNLPNRKVWHA